MAVPAAVSLVRQIQSIVETPELLKKNGCLDQVSSFLDCFLDHPDCRARLGAARALAQLAKSLDPEDLSCLELHQAPGILARLRAARKQSGASADDKELYSLLVAVLEGNESQELPGAAGGVSVGSALRSAGEVVRLKSRIPLDEQAKTAVRQALVQVEGVVSVTFEALETIVVGARTSELARDPTFVEDICTHVEGQLQHCEGHVCGKVLVTPATQVVDLSDSEPEYMDDEDEDEDDDGGNAQERPSVFTGQMPSACPGNGSASGSPDDCDDDEPSYIDDSADEDEPEAEAPQPGQTPRQRGPLSTWCFFSSTTGFFTAQRISEYQDDPTLVARLRRAQIRLERRRKEEQSRLQRVLSVITPLRTRACSEAAKRGAVAFETPGVE